MNQRLWRTVSKSLVLTIVSVVFVVSEAWAQPPVWDPINPSTLGVSGMAPQLRRESRTLSVVVNFNERARIYYAVYTTANDPGIGAITAAALKAGTTPGTRVTFAGSAQGLIFGDASYCRNPYPNSNPLECAAVDGNVAADRAITFEATAVTGHVIYVVGEDFVVANTFSPIQMAGPVSPAGAATNCTRVGSTTLGPIPTFSANLLNNCSPATFSLGIGYVGVDFSTAQITADGGVLSNINFGDFSPTGTNTPLPLQNSPLGTPELNKAFRLYQAIIPHVYDYNAGANPAINPTGSACTFFLDVEFNAGATDCSTFGVDQSTTVTVWDRPNTIRGLQDVEPNGMNNDDGGLDDEEFEICQGDRTDILFTDNSEYNCSVQEVARAPLPNAPNNQARWVQWVYGAAGTTVTTSGAANDQVRIGGVDFTAAQLPIYGPVIYVPAVIANGTNIPNLTRAMAIKMPINAVNGAVLMVEMRSWNTCLPYDNNVGDGGLNPVGGTFDLDGGAFTTAKWMSQTPPATTGTSPGVIFANANTTPVTFQKPIVIVGAPLPPTYTPNPYILCEELAPASYDITFTPIGGAPTYRAYANPALAGPPERTDNTAPFTYNPATQGPAQFDENSPGTYTRYATVTAGVGGGQTCTSLPTTIPIIIEEKVIPGVIAHPGPLTICTGEDPPAFTSTTPASGGRDGTPTYQWQSAFLVGGPYTDIGGATASTYNPPAISVGDRTFFRRAAISDNGGAPTGICATAFSNVISFVVQSPVTGGTIAGDQTVCNGVTNPPIINSTGLPTQGAGAPYTYSWEISTTSAVAGFVAIPATNSPSYDPPAPITQTTWYRRRVNSGVSTGVCSGFAYATPVVQYTVDNAVNAGVINNPQTICSGDDPAVLGQTTPPSGGNGSTYTTLWEESLTGGGAGFGPASGVNNGATYNPPVLTTTTFYRKRVTSGVCVDGFSNEIQITVNPLPTVAGPTGGGSVCSGNPAPDIVWTLTGAAPHTGTWTDGTLVYNFAEPGTVLTPTSFTVTSPKTLTAGTYEILTLRDANLCDATVLGGTATIIIGGTAPTFDSGPSFAVTTVCDDGGATTDPILNFSLFPDLADNFTMTYQVDGSGNRVKPFSTNAAGNPTAAVTFTDAEFNSALPSPHTLTIISILSSAGCQTVFNLPLNFTVVARPPPPAGPVNNTSCSDVINTATISVTAPGAGFAIDWYDMAAGGALLLAGNNSFTPGGALAPAPGASRTFFAETRETGSGLNCASTARTAVVLTSDNRPADPVVGGPQTTCSDMAVLTGNAATNGGTGTWTVGGLIYYETFSSADNNVGAVGPAPPTNTVPASGNWSINLATSLITAADDFLQVQGGQLVAQDTDNDGGGQFIEWRTKSINIAAFPGGVDLSLDVSSSGAVGDDGIDFFYSINGGGPVSFNPSLAVPIAAQTVTELGIIGNTLEVILRIELAGAGNIFIDNVVVKPSSATGAPIIADVNDPTSAVSNLQDGANTFTWTINSLLGACALPPAVLTITKNPQPVSVDILFDLCETNFGTGTANAHDLDVHNAAVSNSLPNRTVTWFLDANLTIPVVPASNIVNINDNDVYYARVVDDITGCTNVTPVLNPGSVTFTVNPLPTVNNPTVVSRTFCEDVQGSGSHAGVNLAVYNPQINATATITWYPTLADAQALTNQIMPGVAAGQVGNYTVLDPNPTPVTARVVDGNSCVNFQEVNFIVNPLPQDNIITGNDVDCSSPSAVKVYQVDPGLNSFGSTHVYNWQIDGAGTNFQVFDGAVFVTTNSYGPVTQNSFLILVRFPNPGTFTFTVSETIDGCTGNDVQKIVTVSGAPPALAFNAPATQVCKNQVGVTYSLTTAPQGGSIYFWSVVGGTINGPSSGNFTSISVDWGSNTVPQPSVSVSETNGSGCAGAPVSVNVFLFDLPNMVSPNAETICSGAMPSSVLTLSADLASNFNWRVVSVTGSINTGVFPGTPVPVFPAPGSTGTSQLTQNLINTSGAAGLVTYEVTPTEINPPNPPNCVGPLQTVTITVNPQPVGTPIATVSRCSDAALGAAYTLNTNVAASTYNITVTNPDGLAFSGATPVAPTGNAAGILADDSWTNTGLVSSTITYNVTPVSPLGCVGQTYMVSVDVDPEPIGNAIPTVSRCSDTALGAAYTLTSNAGSVAAATYNITITNPDGLAFSGATPVAPTGNAPGILTDDSWTNTGTVFSVITYNVTPVSAAGCLGTSYNVSVNIDPEPVGNPVATVSRCSDVVLGAAYTLSSSGGSVAAATYNITITNPDGLAFSGATPVAPTGNAAGILTDDSWTNTGLIPSTITYNVTPVSAIGCLGNTYAVAVNVDPEPVGNPIVTISRCSDTVLGVAYNLTTTAGSVAAASYNITVTNVDGLAFSGATPVAPTGNAAGILADDSWTNTGTVFSVISYNITPVSAAGCLGNPYTVSVNIDPEPVGNPIATVSRCSDSVLGAAYTLSSSGGSVAASTYNITITNPGGLVFSGATPVAATGNPAGILIDDSWTNSGTVASVITYNVTPVSGIGCLGNTYAVAVNIDPEPVGNPIPTVSRCSDVALGAAYALTSNAGSVAAATYNITVTNVDGLAFSGATPVAPTGNTAGILTDDSWTNTGTVFSVITYNITPVSAAGCLGNPYSVSVNIDPEPVGNPIVAVSRCSDTALGAAYTLSSSGGSVAASTYNITITNPDGLIFSGATPVAATGNAAGILTDDSWTNTGLVASTITYNVTPVSAIGCLGNTYPVAVNIDPEPVGNPIPTVSRCSDIALGAAYTLTSSGASVAAATYNITITNVDGLAFSGATPVAPTGNAAGILTDDSWTNTGTAFSVITYNITPVSAVGCLGNPYSVSVNVDPEPVGTPIATVSRCSDTALGAAYTLSSSGGSVAASTYNITITNPDGLAFSGATPAAPTGNGPTILQDDSWTNTGLVASLITYNVTPVSGAGCLGNQYSVSVSINPEPVGDPVATISRCSDVTLGVAYTLTSNVASVMATTYNITITNPGALIFSGATPAAATGNAPNILEDDSWTNTGLFAALVTYNVTPVSALGCLGDPYAVSVNIDPEPVGTPIVQVSRCSDVALGAAYTLNSNGGSVAAATYNITITNPDGLAFSGATPVAPTGNLSAILNDDSWTNTGLVASVITYNVTPVSAIGCLGNQYAVSVSIDPEPVGNPIVQVSRCSDVVLGAAYNLSSNAGSVAAATYNITITNPDGLAFSGATPVTPTGNGPTILQDDSWTNTGLGSSLITYNVTPVSAAGCLGNQYVVSVSIDPEPVGTPIPQVSICSDVALGGAYTLSSNVGSVAAATYNITITNPGGLIFSGATPVTATGNPFNILEDDSWTNTGLAASVITYNVTPVSAIGCLGNQYAVSVSIDPEPVGTPIVQVARCSDVALGAAYTLSSNAGSVAASTYNITVSNPGGLIFSGATPAAPTGNGPAILADDSWTNTGLFAVVVTYNVTPVSAIGCLGNQYAVNVSIDPEPVGTPIPQVSRCSDVVLGGAYTLSSSGASVNAFTYNITVSNPGGLIFSGSNPPAATGNLANRLEDDSWTNTGLIPVVVTYNVTPVSAIGCLGDQYAVSVSIDPEPVGTPIPQVSRCSDVAIGAAYALLSNAGSVAAATYNITITNPGSLIFSGATPVAPTGNPANILQDDSWTNTGTAAAIVTYNVTPVSAAGCLGNQFAVSVSIDPEPVGNPIATVTRCSDGALGAAYTLSGSGGSVAAASFNITITNPDGLVFSGATPVAPTGNPSNILVDDRWTNTGLIASLITYNVTPVSTIGCLGDQYAVSVSIDPEPVGTPVVQVSRCSDVALGAAYTLSSNPASVAAASYNITVSNPGGLIFSGATPVAPTGNADNILEDDSWTNTGPFAVLVTYNVVPVSAAGCLGNSYAVNVSIDPEPVGTPITQVSRCSDIVLGNAYTLSSNPASVAASTYNITISNPGALLFSGATPVAPTGNPANILEDDSWTNTGLFPVIVTYNVTPVSAIGCLGNQYTVNVSIDPEPVGANSAATRCSDEAFGAFLTLSTSGASVPASTYNIVVSNPGGLIFSGATPVAPTGNNSTILTDDSWRNTSAAPVDVVYNINPVSGTGCIGELFTVTMTINPEPTAPALTTVEHCSDAVTPFGFDLQNIVNTGNGITSVFSYTVSSTNPLTVFPESNRNTPSAVPISHIYTNYSSSDVTITYVVTPFSSPEGCQGTNFDFKVIVHPEPVGSNVNNPVCSTTLNHDIQSQITNPAPGLNSIFTYTFMEDPGNPTVVPQPPAVFPYDRSVASAAPIQDSFVNTTGSPATVTYTITPFNAANPTCPGSPFTYTVTISPNPTGVNSVEPAECSDVPFTLDPQNNIVPPVPSTFTWTATYDAPLSGPASGSGMITGSLHNETNGQLFAHYTVTPTAGVCVGAPFTIDLPVNPEPVMLPSLSAPPAVCSTNAVSTNPINVILRTNGPSQAADSYIITLKSQDPDLIGTPTTGTFPANSPIAGESDAIAMDTYRNTTAAQLKVVYTVIPVSAAPASCQGDAFDITVSINPEPVLDDPGFPAVCSSNTAVNNPVNIVLGTNGVSVNAAGYQLQNVQYSTGGPFSPVAPAGVTPNPGNAVIMGAFGSNNLIRNDRYNNTSAAPVTVRYTIQGRSSALCLSEPLDYDVVIDPEPTLVPGTATTCSGIPVAPPLTLMPGPTSPAITSYELQQINIPAGVAPNGGNAGLGVYATGTFLQADFFFNTLDVNRDVVYTIVPISGTCRGVAQIVTVTIQPAPAMFANLNAKACNETASGIILLDNSIGNPMATAPFSAAAATFDITSITLAPGVTAFGGTNTAPRITASQNEISGDQFTNNTNNPLTVEYRVVPISAAGCRGPEKLIILTIEPRIIADDPPDDLVCSSVGGAANTNIMLTSPTNPSSGLVTFNYTAVSSMIGPTAQIGGFSSGLGNLPEGYTIADALVNTSNVPGTVTYTITPIANSGGGAGCNVVGSSVAQQTVVITVDPKPKVVTTFSPVPVCEGDPTSVQLTTPTVPTAPGTIQFNVAATPNGGMTLTSVLKTNYLPGEFITDVWNNPTGDPQTVQYTITPSVSGGLGCPGDPTDIFVTINPRPQVQPVTQADICSGTSINIPLNQVAPPVATGVITWTVSAPGVSGAVGGAGNAIAQTLFNNTSAPVLVTYTVTPKAGSCNGTPLVISFNVNPNPTITTLPSQITICEGTSPNVALTSAVAGTTFAWTVTDLNTPPHGLALNGFGPVINQVIPNTTGSQAAFLYEVTPTGPTGCVGPPKFMTVNVISIIPDVVPDKSVICSGERVQFFNQTLGFGPGGHRWFYRVQGTTAEIDVKTSAVVNYQFTNTTATNPLIYEVVYQASNTGSGFSCTKAPVVVPITVYRNVVADWDPGVIPSLKGGSSVVNFTNTSTPVDPQFRYEWDFGDKATPATFIGATPPPVDFSQQGPHVITLKAINIAAEAPGPGCMDIESRTIVIPVDPLVADFVLDPTAACFPSTVKVIENLATGNVMEWEVIDSNGKLVTTSNLNTPEFLIRTPGLYTVNLTTSDSFLPGLVASSQQTFEIYDKPIASFQARPTTVFVPDTELNTFNFSTGANFYEWDFGDGETSDEREAKHIYKIEGVYDVVLVAGFEHDDGIICLDSATQKISAKQGGQTKIPNAFTPNPAGPSGGFNGGGSGSGGAGSFNDVFLPIVKGVEEFNMQIFDRWGNLIFESNNSNQGWDGYDKNGRILPSGVYIYKLTLRLSDGQRTTQIGDITMIR